MALKGGDKFAAILDAAQSVIARQGYHRSQISRIAAEAGVAAGTVYLYFQNKPDLLVSLFRDRLGEMIERTRKSLAEKTDPRAKLQCFIEQHFHWLAFDKNLAAVTQIELRQAEPHVQQQISQIMKGYFLVIDEIIEEGQQQGVFRNADPRQIRNMIFGTLDQSVTAWVLSGNRFDLEALTQPTFQLIAGGVCDLQGGAHGHGDFGSA